MVPPRSRVARGLPGVGLGPLPAPRRQVPSSVTGASRPLGRRERLRRRTPARGLSPLHWEVVLVRRVRKSCDQWSDHRRRPCARLPARPHVGVVEPHRLDVLRETERRSRVDRRPMADPWSLFESRPLRCAPQPTCSPSRRRHDVREKGVRIQRWLSERFPTSGRYRSACCRQVAATLHQTAVQGGTRGTGEGSHNLLRVRGDAGQVRAPLRVRVAPPHIVRIPTPERNRPEKPGRQTIPAACCRQVAVVVRVQNPDGVVPVHGKGGGSKATTWRLQSAGLDDPYAARDRHGSEPTSTEQRGNASARATSLAQLSRYHALTQRQPRLC